MNPIKKAIEEGKEEFEELSKCKSWELNKDKFYTDISYDGLSVFLSSYTHSLLKAVKESLPDKKFDLKMIYGFNYAIDQIKQILEESMEEIK